MQEHSVCLQVLPKPSTPFSYTLLPFANPVTRETPAGFLGSRDLFVQDAQ